MRSNTLRVKRRVRRKHGLRRRISGTAERPRLSVFRSLRQIYAQIIDDRQGVTLCSASSSSKDLRGRIKCGGNTDAAKVVGSALAEQAKSRNIEKVCFDRNGARYHGRVKALAEAAREGGLAF